MKIVPSQYSKWINNIYYYKSDLEKIPTRDLIRMLRSCRASISNDTRYKQVTEINLWDLEGRWTLFEWNDYEYKYAIVWMIKDVLSRRPHITKSKRDRQLRAKYHVKNLQDLHKTK